ncbi:MAG: hypothetical protein U0324_17700 [Polyangiales bacterium]
MGILRGVGFVGAGVLAATSVVLFVTSSRPSSLALRHLVRAGPGTLGVACGGVF